MLRRLYTLLYIAGGLFLFAACSEESNPAFDEQNFTTIFDNSKFDASFFPIDIKQTPDGGYLILGERRKDVDVDPNFTGIYLLKADKYGNFVKEVEVDDEYVNPVGRLMEYQTKYYFFCMQASTQTFLANVDANLEAVGFTSVGGLQYPAAASMVSNGFALLSYNQGDGQSVISLVSPDGAIAGGPKGFSIGVGDKDEIEEPIIKHYTRTGRRYPFEVGRMADGTYYFNGFYNYTFSLVFADFNSDDPQGVVQGQLEDGGFSAVTYLGANKFATARFNYEINYLLPNKALSTSGESSSTDLGGYTLPELVPNAHVKILRATVDTKNALVYASDTRSKQIGLYFYDEADGHFLSSRYLGFSNPFEIANLTTTADGGLAVCGTTYLAGRFPRICIFKISKDKLAEQVNVSE